MAWDVDCVAPPPPTLPIVVPPPTLPTVPVPPVPGPLRTWTPLPPPVLIIGVPVDGPPIVDIITTGMERTASILRNPGAVVVVSTPCIAPRRPGLTTLMPPAPPAPPPPPPPDGADDTVTSPNSIRLLP